MDRLSFSAQRKRIAKSYPFFMRFAERFRDHIYNPSKPPLDKGGFTWSGKRDSPRSDPKHPFQVVRGVNIIRA